MMRTQLLINHGLVIEMESKEQEKRHRIMQRIRSKDTSIELILRKKLWAKGYRYRKNDPSLPGKPDIVFPRYKLVVFCDSEFFHGKKWEELKKRLRNGKKPEFWIAKIERNMERDRQNTEALQKKGWFVLRLWGDDIIKNPDKCVGIVEETIRNIYGPVNKKV